MPPLTRTIQVTKIRDVDEQFLTADLKEMEILEEEARQKPYQPEIVWRNVAIFAAIHFGALIGAYQFLFVAKWQTVLFTIFLHIFAGFGVTAGAHRLWAHRCYKARLPTRIILMIANTLAFQNDVIEWARDHRCHHKWTDTDADPHNIKRGVFFSHVGWLMMKKHPKIREMGAKIDLSDLYEDPVLVFQQRYHKILGLILAFLLPAVIPVYYWGENGLVSFYVASIFRLTFTLNTTWLINSAAHMFGYKPYDKNISPSENIWTTVTALGEGAHNFHHSFPQDYRASEMGYSLNWTRVLIDALALFGQAYDRKAISEEAIARQKAKQGDHHNHYYN